MSNLIEVFSGLSNYYGSVYFVKKDDGKFYMEIEDLDDFKQVEISENFFNIAIKEFNK